MDQTLQLKVSKIENETSTIKTFTFISTKYRLPQFGAGAHITLHLPIGRRQYSLVNNPLLMKNKYVIAVKKIGDSNSGSCYMHNSVKEGDLLTVSAPDNYFPVHLEAKHHVFFAAGIGITPFISMMAYLNAIGHTFELHYAASHQKECAFYHHIRTQSPNSASFYFMKRNEKVASLRKALENRTVGTHIYVCGPQSFMDSLVDHALELGYPKKFIHEERFRPATKIEHPQPFRVTLIQSKQNIEVQSDQTLLDALLHHNVNIPYNCRMGVCGTCEVAVEDGEVLHCETFLTDEEKKGKMLSCVSRGIDHIKLDL